LNEGLGIVLLEAQAMGVPVVASKVGGIPEAVKDYETGILVPPANSKELAYSILNILTKPEMRAKLSKTAVKWVTEPVDGKPRFGMERMFDKIENLYKVTLNQ
jgi:glycosyltransferase involved in cell wall biosynthesis